MEDNNTRRYPRTINEAFPNGADYACAIEVFEKTSVCGACLRVGAVMAVGLLALRWVVA